MSANYILYGIQILRYTWWRDLTGSETPFATPGQRMTDRESIETSVETPFSTDDLSIAVAWVNQYQMDEMLKFDVGWYKANGDGYSWESNDGRIMSIVVYDNVLLTKINK